MAQNPAKCFTFDRALHTAFLERASFSLSHWQLSNRYTWCITSGLWWSWYNHLLFLDVNNIWLCQIFSPFRNPLTQDYEVGGPLPSPVPPTMKILCLCHVLQPLLPHYMFKDFRLFQILCIFLVSILTEFFVTYSLWPCYCLASFYTIICFYLFQLSLHLWQNYPAFSTIHWLLSNSSAHLSLFRTIFSCYLLQYLTSEIRMHLPLIHCAFGFQWEIFQSLFKRISIQNRYVPEIGAIWQHFRFYWGEGFIFVGIGYQQKMLWPRNHIYIIAAWYLIFILKKKQEYFYKNNVALDGKAGVFMAKFRKMLSFCIHWQNC